jgi:hypothetical protein
MTLAKSPRGLDAVTTRHAEIHEDNVGAKFANKLNYLLAIGGHADDFEPRQEAN